MQISAGRASARATQMDSGVSVCFQQPFRWDLTSQGFGVNPLACHRDMGERDKNNHAALTLSETLFPISIGWKKAHRLYISACIRDTDDFGSGLIWNMVCSRERKIFRLEATIELRPLPFAAGVLEMVLAMAACDSAALLLLNKFRLLFFFSSSTQYVWATRLIVKADAANRSRPVIKMQSFKTALTNWISNTL